MLTIIQLGLLCGIIKMIPEQKFIVLAYCLSTYIDLKFFFFNIYLIFNDVQQLCLKACLME